MPVGTASTTSSFLTHDLNWLAKNDCKTRREVFKCWDFSCLILEVCWCLHGCAVPERFSFLLLIKHASNVTINRCLTNRFRRKLRLMQETVAYPRHNTNVYSMVFEKMADSNLYVRAPYNHLGAQLRKCIMHVPLEPPQVLDFHKDGFDLPATYQCWWTTEMTAKHKRKCAYIQFHNREMEVCLIQHLIVFDNYLGIFCIDVVWLWNQMQAANEIGIMWTNALGKGVKEFIYNKMHPDGWDLPKQWVWD